VAVLLAVTYHHKRLAQPFFRLADSKATEQEVIEGFGRPEYTARDVAQLRQLSMSWSPQPPMKVESKVLVYHVSSLMDEYQFYVYIDYRNRVNRVVMAGT
jgi:hypothetical protein